MTKFRAVALGLAWTMMLSLCSQAVAQKLVVAGNFLGIPSGALSPLPDRAALLPKTTVGVPTETSFQTINNSETTILTVTTITLSGSSNFSFSVSSIGPILPGAHGTIGVVYTPTQAGDDNAIITVESNDPTQSNYTFAIMGNCLPSLLPKSDISPGFGGSTPLMKMNQKTGKFSFKWKLDVSNFKPGESGAGLAMIYSSSFPYVDFSDNVNCRYIGEVPFKSIKGSTATKISHKKINVKLKDLPTDANQFTYVIAVVLGANEFEDQYDNNALVSEFDTDK